MPDLVFSGRPAGRPAYAPLCERAAPPPGVSPARSPRLAAPLLGPVGPARFSGSPSPRPPRRWPPSLRYTRVRRRRPGTARLAARTSPLRGAAAGPRPGARLAARSLRFPVPAGSDRTSPRRSSRSRPAGPPRCRRCSPVTTARGGGRVPLPRSPPPAEGGRGRGRAPTRQAPCWLGTEGEGSGAVPISLLPDVLGAQHPPQSFFIPLGITGADDESSSLALCVIVSRNCGSPDRVESNLNHIYL